MLESQVQSPVPDTPGSHQPEPITEADQQPAAGEQLQQSDTASLAHHFEEMMPVSGQQNQQP